MKANNVIWLWDQRPGEHNTVIIWEPPTSETDLLHHSGQGRIFEPKDSAFKDGKITWTIAPTTKPVLAPIRRRVLDLIEAIPFKFAPAYKVNFPNGRPALPGPAAVKGTVSNCGEFPGWIARNIGGSNAPKDILIFKFHDQWGDYALTAP